MKIDTIYLIGNAHLDPAWLWSWQEGFAEAKATFRSALDRMNEYPDFKFVNSASILYKFLEKNNPEMFEEVRQRVREGRWNIVGGWIVQPDCNIPSGESFARHALYGQRYFMEKFGVTCTIGYNTDSFGHNASLPQILQKSGMSRYVYMRPENHECDLPASLFNWESPDGSCVLAYRIPAGFGNNFRSHEQIRECVETFDRDCITESGSGMLYYGVCNHGGGPTIQNIELLKSFGDERMKFATAEEYFYDMQAFAEKAPVYRGELQRHAIGCYAAVSAIKAYNRKAEHRLAATEVFSTMANKLCGTAYDNAGISAAWETVLFNQFHDIMGGCSIKQVCDEAIEFYGEALTTAAKIQNNSLQSISWAIDTMGENSFGISKEIDSWLWEDDKKGIGAPYVVFNPHPWEVSAPVKVNKTITSLADEKGAPVPLQAAPSHIRSSSTKDHDSIFIAKIPAYGYRTYRLFVYKQDSAEYDMPLEATRYTLENSFLKVTIGQHGYIASVYDKQTRREVFDGNAAVPYVYNEENADTWGHGIDGYYNKIGQFAAASVTLSESGKLYATIKSITHYESCTLTQYITMYSDRKEIRVRCILDMRGRHRTVKLSFPANLSAATSTHEIPYGTLSRPNDGKECATHRFVDITEGDNSYGVTLVNDSKYSLSVSENNLLLTICRTPLYNDHGGARDEDCYCTDQGIQEFNYWLLPHSGAFDAATATKRAAECNQPLTTIAETYHRGTLPETYNGISISHDNIIPTALKQAESGDGYILRAYEAGGRNTTTAEITLPLLNATIKSTFTKHEIKTFLINNNGWQEVNLLELP